MARAPTTGEDKNDEREKVFFWRYSQLRLAGADPKSAEIIAEIPEISLHVAVEMLEHGCSPVMMVEILT